MNDGPQPVNDVAALIGVTARTLYLRIKGHNGWPKLPAVEIRGVLCVRPADAYLHFVNHGARKPPALRPPPGATLPAGEKKDWIDPDIRKVLDAMGNPDPMAADIHELTHRLALAGVPESKIKTFATVAREMRGKKDSALKAGKTFTPDDVVRMLRGLCERFVDEIETGEARCVDELLAAVRKQTGKDLVDKHPEIKQVLLAVVREQLGGKVIEALRRHVDDGVRGVQALEFTA